MGGKRGWRRGAAAVPVTALVLVAGCDLGAPPTAYEGHGPVAGIDDVDGDGHLDVVTEGEGSFPGQFTVLLGDGSGGFSTTTVPHTATCTPSSGTDFSFECTAPRVTGVADVDGDGRADLVIRSEASFSNPIPALNWDHALLHVRLADGSGGFGPPTPVDERDVESETGWRTVDATGDGHIDLVRLRRDTPTGVGILVRPGDGTGQFGPDVVTSWGPGRVLTSSQDLAFADLDGDGHTDLVLGGGRVGGTGEDFVRGQLAVGLGDGTGAYPDQLATLATDPGVDALAGVAIGDVDGDGHLDVVAGNYGNAIDGDGPVGSLSWFPGTGDGGFGPEARRPATSQTEGVRLADFDGDGQLDVLAAVQRPDGGDDNWSRVMFGDGAGGFGHDHLLPPGNHPVADLDGDGRPDVVRSVDVFEAPDRIEVYLNRWDGRP